MGTGGRKLRAFGTIEAHGEVRNADTLGVGPGLCRKIRHLAYAPYPPLGYNPVNLTP